MRHRWQPPAPVDDVDSLQADVMRFVAIIGLCLAAIFSLVNAAGREALTPEQVLSEAPASAGHVAVQVAEQVVQAPRPTAKRVHPDTAATVPSEPSPAPPSAPGFSLAFESHDALRSLIALGVVGVYAVTGDRFLPLQVTGQLREVAAPGSYYRMHEATLPPDLRAAAEGLVGSVDRHWGITLPPATVTAITGLMADHAGGELLIAADATVSLN